MKFCRTPLPGQNPLARISHALSRVRIASWFVLLACTLVAHGQAFGARANIPKEPFVFVFAPERTTGIDKVPQDSITVGDFARAEVRKFLMIAGGPEVIDHNFKSSTAFLGKIGDDQCRLLDAPFTSVQPFSERAALFVERNTQTEACLMMRVRDNGGALRVPDSQPNCRITRLDENTVLAKGGLCFFQIGLTSVFSVEYITNPDCRNPAFVRTQGLPPSDFTSYSGYYIAGDASGSSFDLTPLGAASVRLVLEPSPSLLPLTQDVGPTQARWPSEIHTNVHMGEVSARNLENGNAIIDARLLVDNTCKRTCAAGQCSSPCDFQAAIGMQMTLADITSSRDVFLAYWVAGAAVPAQWQGFLPAQGTAKSMRFVKGNRYKIDGDVSFPDQYYRLFKQGFEQLLVDLEDFDNLVKTGAFGGTLPTLSLLNPLGTKKQLPPFPALPALLPSGGSGTVSDPLSTLARLIAFEDWPPYYERFCAGKGACKSLRDASSSTRVGVTFTVKDIKASGDVVIGDVAITRTSNLFPSYSRGVASPPRIQCGTSP